MSPVCHSLLNTEVFILNDLVMSVDDSPADQLGEEPVVVGGH
jgi:hypothetical protein